jgi:hypothetical protein
MRYYYSVTTNSFYPKEERDIFIRVGGWPDDAKLVADTVYEQYSGSGPLGKKRIAGPDGLPTWGDYPPLTPEEQQQQAELEKRNLMSQASIAITPLQYAVDLQMETKAEQASLLAWKKYCVLLNRVDCSTAPNIDWPKAPE